MSHRGKSKCAARSHARRAVKGMLDAWAWRGQLSQGHANASQRIEEAWCLLFRTIIGEQNSGQERSPKAIERLTCGKPAHAVPIVLAIGVCGSAVQPNARQALSSARICNPCRTADHGKCRPPLARCKDGFMCGICRNVNLESHMC